jgi:hypothetical protein
MNEKKKTSDSGYSILDTGYTSVPFLLSSIQHPVSSIQYPVSSIQHPASIIQCSFLPEKNNSFSGIPTGDILILPPYGTISERP